MKEQIPVLSTAEGLAIHTQTRYPESRGTFVMPDGVVPETQGGGGAAVAEKPSAKLAEKVAKLVEATKSNNKEAARHAMLEMLVDEKTLAELRKLGVMIDLPRGAAAKEKAQGKPEPTEEKITFPSLPKDPILIEHAQRLIAAPIETFTREELVTSYITMQRQLEQLGLTGTGMLSELADALKSEHGVDAHGLYTLMRQVEQKREKEIVERTRAETRVLHQYHGDLPTDEEAWFDDLPSGGITDDNLTNIVIFLNGIPRESDNPNDPSIRRNRATPDFVQRQVERVEARLDQMPQVRDQAQRLLGGLELWRQASENIRGVERREEYERAEETRTGLYLERKITREERARMDVDITRVVDQAMEQGLERVDITGADIDKLFNRMFDDADSRPREEFGRTAFGPKGEFERNEFQKAMKIIKEQVEIDLVDARREGNDEAQRRLQMKIDIIDKFVEKYDNEFNMREKLHNAFWIAETEGEFQQFTDYCKQFASHYADLAFKDTPEVEAALRIRERVLYEIKEQEGGRIRPELVHYNPERKGSYWDERSRVLLRSLNEKGMFTRDGTRLDDWKINRALSLSRGLGMVFLRFPEIVAETPLPAPSQTNQAWGSPPWEKIVWELNVLDYKAKKYNFGRELRSILYAMAKREKRGIFDLWNQDELKRAIEQDAITSLGSIHDGQRMIDMRNIFYTGGPFTHTGWRPYVSALEPDRSGLRKLLAQNPGLAMKMLYNRHEILDQAIEKYALFQDENLSPDEKLNRFEKIYKLGKKAGGGTTSWGQAVAETQSKLSIEEVKSWVNTARRIPHVILRIITDPANGLLDKGQVQEALDSIGAQIGVQLRLDTPENRRETMRILSEIGEDITLAKENLMKRRRDVIASSGESAWTEGQDQLLEQDFTQMIDSDARRTQAQQFRDAVVNIMSTDTKLQGKVVELVRTSGFPFAVTAEDVPWNEFAFGQTGTRGYFTRKINDAFSVAQANSELEKYLKNFTFFQSPEQFVEQLKKIYDQAEQYDQNRARDTIKLLAIGTIRFLEKDGMLKFPIIGEVMALANKMRGRGASFAETVYGGQAPAWDSDDIYNFTEQLRKILTLEEIQEIRKETGGRWWQALGRKSKIAFYLFLLFFTYETIERIIKEK